MEKHLDVTLKAPYSTLNAFTSRTQRVWLVFHGYGMLSRYFIDKFKVLPPEENFIIAPQGLSRFYLEGFAGRVGASWMTKEDRLTEIANQQTYIRAVLDHELGLATPKELILFGFSQGVATASRFAAFSGISFQKLVLWAGSFPDDLLPEEVAHWPDDLEIRYFTGRQDPYIHLQPMLIERQKELLWKIAGKKAHLTEFDGKHEVIPDLLLTI